MKNITFQEFNSYLEDGTKEAQQYILFSFCHQSITEISEGENWGGHYQHTVHEVHT